MEQTGNTSLQNLLPKADIVSPEKAIDIDVDAAAAAQCHEEEEDANSDTVATSEDKFTYYLVWWLFFLLGTFNNFGYTIILAAAKSLADCFDQSPLIGVEAWALIGVGFFTKSVNAFYLEGISHRVRGHLCGIAFLIGYSLLCFSVYIDFWFSIFSIVCIGLGCSWGESVMLGYCKLFPAKMTGAWSSGTGMAGLAAATLYLLFAEVLKFANQTIFIMMVPTSLMYMLAVECTWRSALRQPWSPPMKKKKQSPKYAHVQQADNNAAKQPLLGSDQVEVVECKKKINGASESSIDDCNAQFDIALQSAASEESRWQQFKRCLAISWYRSLTLLLVYVFEYLISVGIAQIANTSKSESRQDFDYVVLATCYQLGVFLSRSSVSVIELPYFGTMTLLQLLNLILWVIHVQTGFFRYEGVEYILMVYVGLLGGAMYVNCAFSMINDKTINDKDRELCINLMALAVNIGITLSSIIEVIMDNTFYKALVHDSNKGGPDKQGCGYIRF